jgi:membrane protein implicated in regulation of membrane protease activity
MPDWLIWLLAAGVFSVAETATLSLVLAMFAGGSVAAAVTAALGGPVILQVVVALVITGVLLVGVRPIARKHLDAGTGAITGPDALVGQDAIVLSRVDAYDGRVKLNGAEWSARAYDRDQIIPTGSVVRVMSISGATAVVLHADSYFADGGKS